MISERDSAGTQDSHGCDAVPGLRDSAVLAADSLLTLFMLIKTEAALALSSARQLLVLNLLLLPLVVLAWLGLGSVAATGAYAVTGSAVAAATVFLVLQLAAILLLQIRMQRLRARLGFPLSRQGLALMQTSWNGRFPG